MSDFFSNQNILITGGTGSFGQHLAKNLILNTKCQKVIIFSRDELKQWQMQQEAPYFRDERMRYFLGDIRDKQRLMRAFNEVDVVIHAAALKQVPAAEYNPSEFVNTNVLGAMNIIDAAIDNGVKKVIALSTDKAVNPINLYGATKLCSDKLFVAGNAYVGRRGYPIFSVVRYGNVLGSRGSLIPLWQKMIAEGAQELPVTDKEMTRFWITLDQAVDFVIESCANTIGGEIFIPKIPSTKIVDIAQTLAPQLPIKYLGIREGEKLHELLISGEDARHSWEFPNHYVIVPEIALRNRTQLEQYIHTAEAKHLPDGFYYASNTNDWWLSSDDIKSLCSNSS